MGRSIFYLVVIFSLLGCNKDKNNINTDLQNTTGNIEIHRCFCSSSAYRYLIVMNDGDKKIYYNPVNLPENFKDYNYTIVFSANLLNDSSIVYTNAANDALIEDFKVRNIELTDIEKQSELLLNDTLKLDYGKLYSDNENKFSIMLDSVLEDSRCPKKMECVWEGNASVKFLFMSTDKFAAFTLNTSRGFPNDTIISGYKIQLVELNPYPQYPGTIEQKDYKAKIIISN